MDTNKQRSNTAYGAASADAFEVASEVQEILGYEDYIVGVFPAILKDTPYVSVTVYGATAAYPYSDPDIAEKARSFFKRRKELVEGNVTCDECQDSDSVKTLDDVNKENKYPLSKSFNLADENDLLREENTSLVDENGRLKAENIDLKRKLRDARADATRYQKQYLDLMDPKRPR